VQSLLRLATWTFFCFSVSFAGAAAILLALGSLDAAIEVFSWAQQCALFCGACFGLLTIMDIDQRVQRLEDRGATNPEPDEPDVR
jgi:lysylphosphatidylglycerol synthetase-like protein (DUF2156 family)